MKLLLILLTLTCSLFAADPVPEVKLPAEAARVVADRDSAVAKAKAVYDAAVQKANADGVKKLEVVVAKITKTGDLRGALAAQKVQEGWKGEDVVGERVDPTVAAVVGQWKRGITTVTFNGDGTFADSRNISGKWEANKDGSFIMVWSDTGAVVSCSKPNKNITYESGGSSSLTLTKIVE